MGSVILLVDDDVNFTVLVKHAFLKAWPDAQLQTVADGEGAIHYLLGDGDYANRQRFPVPSVVLLDLNMSRIGGFQVLEWKREVADLNALPVVVWSTSDSPADIQKAYALGAVAYLIKPSGWSDYVDLIKIFKTFSRCPRKSEPCHGVGQLSPTSGTFPFRRRNTILKGTIR